MDRYYEQTCRLRAENEKLLKEHHRLADRLEEARRKSSRRKKALRELNKAIQLQSTALRLAYCREELKKKNG